MSHGEDHTTLLNVIQLTISDVKSQETTHKAEIQSIINDTRRIINGLEVTDNRPYMVRKYTEPILSELFRNINVKMMFNKLKKLLVMTKMYLLLLIDGQIFTALVYNPLLKNY